MNYFTITERPHQKTSELLEEAKKLFPVWSYEDFKDFDKDFPAPKKSTTRYFRANIEADEDLKNISADNLPQDKSEYMTLRERIILEIEYFLRTDEHLDVNNITLCAGSRHRYGRVPCVFWRAGDGQLRVGWCCTDNARDNLRARQAVSPFTSNLLPLNQIVEVKIGDKTYKAKIIE